MPEPSPWLSAGRVGRPHGLDGSFHVSEPRAGLLEVGVSVSVAGSEREVLRRAGTAQRPIVRLTDCEGRDAAEALRGSELRVAVAAAPPLGPGEYHPEQLEGCLVRDGSRAVGVVSGVLVLPSCEALEVRRQGDSELIVPMVSDAIRTVDLDVREIDVDLRFVEGA